MEVDSDDHNDAAQKGNHFSFSLSPDMAIIYIYMYMCTEA